MFMLIAGKGAGALSKAVGIGMDSYVARSIYTAEAPTAYRM